MLGTGNKSIKYCLRGVGSMMEPLSSVFGNYPEKEGISVWE